MYRQPYGAYAYVYLDKYIFGRQVEREQASSLLLQAEPLGVENLGCPSNRWSDTFLLVQQYVAFIWWVNKD